jgi:hypothetical protein
MGRKKKHGLGDARGKTRPRQFRLSDETLADLDKIAVHLTETNGVTYSRTDALRYAARYTARGLGLVC